MREIVKELRAIIATTLLGWACRTDPTTTVAHMIVAAKKAELPLFQPHLERHHRYR